MPSNLYDLTLHEARELLNGRQVSSLELTQAMLDRVQQVVPREAFRANFLYVLHDALVPGEYSLVVRCGGQEVARRRIVLEPAEASVERSPVAN